MLGGFIRDGSLEFGLEVLKQVSKAFKVGGFLVFAENLMGTTMHKFFRRHFGAGKNSWRYFESFEICELLTRIPDLTIVSSINVGFLGCFGRNESQRTLLAKLDKIFLEKIIPEKSRYIQFVVARKVN